MNYDKGSNFIRGLLLGGIVGAAVALLMAPTSGEEARYRIRSKGVALKHRGQEFSDDQIREAQSFVKQGQKNVCRRAISVWRCDAGP